MTKIKRLDYNQQRNNEHFQCKTDIRDLIEEFTPKALNIEKLFMEQYMPKYKEEDEVLVKITKSLHAEDRSDADRERDKTFSGMVATNNANLKHFTETIVVAAKRLKILFDTYGNVAILPLQEETSAIYNLLQELRGTYVQDVMTTGLTLWVNKLEADNLNYDRLTKETYEESAAKTELKAKEVRAELDTISRNIVERIEALMIIEGEGNYKEFVRRLNVVLEKYANILAQRKGISAANAEKKKEEQNSNE